MYLSSNDQLMDISWKPPTSLHLVLIHLPCFSFCPRKAQRWGQSADLHIATEYTAASEISSSSSLLSSLRGCSRWSAFAKPLPPQSIARILNPGNSRENQLDFFSLDHEKWFSISRSRLETRDWKKEILVLVSKHEIERKNFSSRKTRFSL